MALPIGPNTYGLRDVPSGAVLTGHTQRFAVIFENIASGLSATADMFSARAAALVLTCGLAFVVKLGPHVASCYMLAQVRHKR
jgi:hypothetical protein